MTGLAVALAALLASSSPGAGPRLEIANFRTICVAQDSGPEPVDRLIQQELARRLADLGRVEHVVVGAAACDTSRGDVVVRLGISTRGPRKGFQVEVAATDGHTTYRDTIMASDPGSVPDVSTRLAERLFDALVFEPHE